MKKQWAFILLHLATCTSIVFGQQSVDLNVSKRIPPSSPIPIAVSGFNESVQKVVSFDLEVLGFEIVPEGSADFILKGHGGSGLAAVLTERSGAKILSRSYSSSSRLAAHTLADEVVEAFRGPKMGISRTKIVFVKGDPQSLSLVYCDYDGANAAALTSPTRILAAPSLRKGIVFFTSYQENNRPYIFAQTISSGEQQAVSRSPGLNTSAAISPDGSTMALIMDRKGGNPDLWTMNLSTGDYTQLTKTPDIESSPSWSPDGSRIVFSRKSGSNRLYTISPSGGQATSVGVVGVSNHTEASWSPDGKWIAFTSQTGGFQICVVPAKGGEAKVLADGEDPSWAPNSRTLIFTKRGKGGPKSLSLLDVPTGKIKDVRQLSGKCSQPYWAN